MATRSFISIFENGYIKGIYCHYNGAIHHNGHILNEYYNKEKTQELIKLGAISCLNKNVDPNNDFEHSFDHPQDDVVIAYHRDRGDKDLTINVFYTIQDFQNYLSNHWISYTYIYHKDKWFVLDKINKKSLKLKSIKDNIIVKIKIDNLVYKT